MNKKQLSKEWERLNFEIHENRPKIDKPYPYVATNSEEPEYISNVPNWVKDKCFGEAEIEEPVGCPECHSWGVQNFENIM